MRLHWGPRRAGYELKRRVIEHSKPPATSRSAAARAPTTPATTAGILHCRSDACAPGSLGMCWADDRAAGGADRRQQVPGARCALAWNVQTAALAREPATRMISIGGRMRTLAEAAGDSRRRRGQRPAPPTAYHSRRERADPRAPPGCQRSATPCLGIRAASAYCRFAVRRCSVSI